MGWEDWGVFEASWDFRGPYGEYIWDELGQGLKAIRYLLCRPNGPDLGCRKWRGGAVLEARIREEHPRSAGGYRLAGREE